MFEPIERKVLVGIVAGTLLGVASPVAAQDMNKIWIPHYWQKSAEKDGVNFYKNDYGVALAFISDQSPLKASEVLLEQFGFPKSGITTLTNRSAQETTGEKDGRKMIVVAQRGPQGKTAVMAQILPEPDATSTLLTTAIMKVSVENMNGNYSNPKQK